MLRTVSLRFPKRSRDCRARRDPAGSRRALAFGIGAGREATSDELPQDAALDRLVGEGRMGPPPGVLLHGARGGHETIRNRIIVGVAIVEAEDQPTGTDPAERQPFGAQVI